MSDDPGAAETAGEAVAAEPNAANWKRRAWQGLKIFILALLLVGIGLRGKQLWKDVNAREMRFSAGWLLAAVGMYIAGMLPSALFWAAIMRRLGNRIRYTTAIRAHYSGQPAKYLPGKALVLMIRSSLAAAEGVGLGTAAVTATYETLVTMASGLALALMLVPWSFPPALLERWHIPPGWVETAEGRWLFSLAAFILSGLGLIFATRLFGSGVKRLLPARLRFAAEIQWSALSTRWLLGWFLTTLAGWWVQGLSLGCTLRGVTAESFQWGDWPACTAAVSASTSIGFAVLLVPAGAGVREELIAEMLRWQIGSAALVVAVAYRAVTFVGEILAAGLLYYGIRPVPVPQQPPRESD